MKGKELLDCCRRGYRVRKARRAQDIRQADLAKQLGISASLLSYLESGNRRWRDDMYELACDILGIEAEAPCK